MGDVWPAGRVDMIERLLVLLLAVPALAPAVKNTVTQRGEVVTAPRPSSSPTRLLFPFVRTNANVETEITISNTTSDNLGTTATPGSCQFFYFGSIQFSSIAIAISPGSSLVYRVSQGVSPNVLPVASFVGYIIADCNFPLARGSARVLSGGT